jgi:hypothetical protein
MTLSIMRLSIIEEYCAKCHMKVHYAECHYAECRSAECRYAECRYAECRYAECRGARKVATFVRPELA